MTTPKKANPLNDDAPYGVLLRNRAGDVIETWPIDPATMSDRLSWLGLAFEIKDAIRVDGEDAIGGAS